MPELAGKRVLVTGATGFIGANLVRRLLGEAADVHACTLRGDVRRLTDVLDRVRLHRVDLAEPDDVSRVVRASRPEVVFHLAAHGVLDARPDLARLEAATAGGTRRLLEACRDCEAFVHVGGSSEYGPHEEPLREDMTPAPVTAYGRAKAAATLAALEAAERGLPVSVLRPFSVYGPWESPARLVPTAIRAALTGAVLPLTPAGFRRDYVFVDDVVDALVLATRSGLAVGEVVNVGTGVQTANEDVAAAIAELTGREIRVDAGAIAPKQSDTTHWVADTRKASRVLGWQAQTALRAGLAITIKHFRGHAAGLVDTG